MMQRLRVRRWSALLVLAAIGLFMPGDRAAARELKLAHFMPTVHTLHQEVFEPLAADLARATGGALSIRIYPSGTLGKGPEQQFKRAVTGVADIAFCIQGYSPGIFPRSLIVTEPGVSLSAEQGTRRVWDLYEDHLKPEYEAVKVLGIWVMSPTVLMTRSRPVASAADLQGMKVRIGSPVESDLIQAWGAVPVAMPITEAYNALNTGVVDAVLIQPNALYDPWNLAEPARFATLNLPSSTSIVCLVMNKAVWEGLPADQQEALDRLTGREFSIRSSIIWSRKDVTAVEKARSDGTVGVVDLTPDQRSAFETAARPAIEEHLQRLEAQGIHGRDIYQAFKR